MSMTLTYFKVALALLSQSALIYQCFQYKDVLYRDIPKFFLKWWSMVILALGLATLFHPGKKGQFFFTLQMFVSFTIFLEALAMVP